MEGYQSLGLGLDIRSEGQGPGQFDTPMATPLVEQAGKAWDDQYLGPEREEQRRRDQELQFLQNMRGFAQATMSKNVNSNWGLNNNRDLPYDLQVGPSKGATVTGGGAIVFDEPGYWKVILQAHARATNFTGDIFGADSVDCKIRLRGPNNELLRETLLEQPVARAGATVHGQVTWPIYEPGTYVAISCWTSRWRWWDGGQRFALLTVERLDERTEHTAPDTVPDEDQP